MHILALIASGATAALGAPVQQPVTVPAGPAILGSNDPATFGLSGPKPYDIPAFAIDPHEVTNAEYAAFVRATGRAPAEFRDEPEFADPDQPVTGVTWDDANAYCQWAGKRLPTEREWEKAARGTDGRLYPWGDEYDPARAHLSGDLPVAVKSFPGDVSPYGLFDMAGNVSEWVADTRIARAGICGVSATEARLVSDNGLSLEDLAALYGEVGTNLCRSPEIPAELYAPEPCAYIKGSSFAGRPHMVVSSNRMWDYTNAYSEFVGFRCAADE